MYYLRKNLGIRQLKRTLGSRTVLWSTQIMPMEFLPCYVSKLCTTLFNRLYQYQLHFRSSVIIAGADKPDKQTPCHGCKLIYCSTYIFWDSLFSNFDFCSALSNDLPILFLLCLVVFCYFYQAYSNSLTPSLAEIRSQILVLALLTSTKYWPVWK